jgi:hypothetical protein
MSLTHLADLLLTDLLSSNLFGVWAEWQLPCDEKSPPTSVKQQNFDSEQLGNQAAQIAIITVNTVTSVLYNRLFCCRKKFLF